MNRSNIILILRILIGATFIFSGISKLDSIYQFEQAIFKAGVTDWNIIPYLSRFTIAFEILLGICFFHHEGLKKFTIPATFFLLLIFCVHLTYTIITEGGMSGNCGCFGEKLPMTPFQSLLKNIVTLGMLVYLYKVPIEKPAREVFIPISLGVLSFVFIFSFFPIKNYIVAPAQTELVSVEKKDSTVLSPSVPANEDTILKANAKEIKKEEKKIIIIDKNKSSSKTVAEVTKETPVEKIIETPKPTRVTSKYASFKSFSNGINTNLDEDKKIVCMYNTGCDHCMENARKMCELNKKTKLPPVFILFWGSENEIPAFFEFAKCSFPYKLLEPQVFFPLLGKGNFPKVSYLYEGNIIGEWEGDDFSPVKLEDALKK